MGLDIDLVKFDKEFYDSAKDVNNVVEYFEGTEREERLVYWRKRYDIRNLLADCCGTRHLESDYGELTRLGLKKVLRQAMRQKEHEGQTIDQDEMKILIPVLRKILHQTDFKTETIALSWIS